MKRALRSAIGLILLLAGPLRGAELKSGAAYLTIDSAARPAAMSGAYTASRDLDAIAYNPGGLAALSQKEVAFTHAEWLESARYDYLAFGLPTRIGTFGLSALRLGYGDFEGRDLNRQLNGSFDAHDAAYGMAYARTLGAGIGLGAAVKLLERKIAGDDAISYAFDVGALGRVPYRPLWIGFSVLNIGPGMRFIDQTDPLPLTLAAGAAYEPSRRLRMNADFKYWPHDKRSTAIAGVEYAPFALLALRSGYQFPIESTGDSIWAIENVRGGLGLHIYRLRLDYALAPFGDLGLTHRITLALRFGSEQAASEPIQEARGPNPEQDLYELLRQVESPDGPLSRVNTLQTVLFTD